MFSRCFARPKVAKSKYIFKSEGRKTGGDVVACLPFGVPTWAGGRGTLAILLALAKIDKIPSFCPLSRFVLVGLSLEYAFIRILRGFLEGFPCWMWVCIVRVLCVACGAFVCVSG